jgi:lysyl-tRNA synthetase class 1
MSSAEKTYWADRIADQAAQKGGQHLVSTGITPSGDIHIGNMREILTGDAIFRALSERGVECRFNYIADNSDPLRRVYPFLDKAIFEQHVGKPLCDIPCPCGDHGDYAEHFLAPFIQALDRLGVQVDVVRADEAYRRGDFDDVVITALTHQSEIETILQEETGKEVADDWSPFNVICTDCGRMTDTTVTGFDPDAKTVSYKCRCGGAGTVPIAGNGKLTWRVDWPARWRVFGVTIEPFGKDHASKGGSYDTGSRIAREVYGIEPPLPIPYEWISLRGKGDMSSSKGNVITISEVLDVVPAEVLRYFIFKSSPTKSLGFEPGLPLLNLFDEYAAAAEKGGNRAVDLAKVGADRPLGIPYRHIVSLIQTTGGNIDRIAEILERNGVEVNDMEKLQQLVDYASRWLETFAPEEVKFQIQDSLPVRAGELSDEQKRFLALLAEQLQHGMNADQIHSLIYAIKEEHGMAPGAVFKAIYVSLLGKDRGPRAGWFLSSLDMNFLKKRFAQAAAA